MSDAQLLHACTDRWPRGEESYQGKLLEARQNDYKDEIVLVIINGAHNCARIWEFGQMIRANDGEDGTSSFEHFGSNLPKWFTNFVDYL